MTELVDRPLFCHLEQHLAGEQRGLAKRSAAIYRASIRDVLRCVAVMEDPPLANKDVSLVDAAAQTFTSEILTVDNLRAAFTNMQAGAFRSPNPGTPRSDRSMRVVWSSVNGFCVYLVQRGVIAGNPMAGVEIVAVPEYQPTALRAVDAHALFLAAAEPPDRNIRIRWPLRDVAIIGSGLLLGAGARELRTLTVGDLSGAPGSMTLRLGDRTRNQRALPVPHLLEDALVRYLDDRAAGVPRSIKRRVLTRSLQYDSVRPPRLQRVAQNELLFVTTAGEPMNEAHLYNVVGRVYTQAGVGKDACGSSGLVHALRNTFISGLREAGTSREEIDSLLGYVPPSKSERDSRRIQPRSASS